MIYRNVDGNICETKKIDFPNDSLYYKKIYENMLKIAKTEPILLKKAFQDKEKKQSKEKKKNIATSNVHV